MIALLMIDLQNAYFEDPVLAAERGRVVHATNELLDGFATAGLKALLIGTEHEQDKSTWSLNMLDDDQGFIFRGSAQANFVPALKTDGLPRLVKTRDSAFVGTDLLARLRNWAVEEVVLAGVSTHNCIAQTGADAFARNIRVTYAADAVASEDAQAADAMLGILAAEYRQQIQSNTEIMDRLKGFGQE
jgi:nicotinamidase-related amidase